MAVVAIAEYDTYRRELDQFLSDRREPAAMLDGRWRALERFEALGIPSRQHEAWRLTDVSGLANRRFARAGEAPVDAGLLPTLDEPHYRLTFVNGRFAPGLSRLPSGHEKAVISSLSQALSNHPELVEASLGSVPGLEDHPFSALNGAFWEDGAFIHLPRGLVLEHPLHLVFYATGPETRNYPRNVIMLEAGAQAVIVEEHRGSGDYLSCPFTEVHTAEGAILDYYKVQQENGWHLGALALRQERDSRIHGHLLSLGGPLIRTDVVALLMGAGAECLLDGLTLVADGELGDQHIRMEHATPHGVSRQVFKGVLAGKSKTVFDGMVHVRKGAQKTEAMQNNRNLLLSRQAQANSNPRLEILADDVKCSHGSSIGFLDPDALFYLRSRGIGQAQARAMLVHAFAIDSIEQVGLPDLRQRLEKVLLQRLAPENSGN